MSGMHPTRRLSPRAGASILMGLCFMLVLSPALAIVQPKNVSASDGLFTDRVEISWDSVVGIAWYSVYRSTSPGGDLEYLGYTQNTWFDDYTVPEAQPYVLHYYWVQADDGVTTPTDISDYDIGWRSPDFKRIYKIVHTDSDVEVYDGSSLFITKSTNISTIKIREMSHMPTGVDIVDGVGLGNTAGVFYLVCAVIPDLIIDGNIRKVYTEAPVWNFEATGSIWNLSARHCYVMDVRAAAFGYIKMGNPDWFWSNGTWIENNGQWVPLDFRRADVYLTGIGLDNLVLPDQRVKIRASAKKSKDALGYFLKPADIFSVHAGKFMTAVAYGGNIWGDVLCNGDIRKVVAKAMTFNVPGVADPYGGILGGITEDDTYALFVSGLNADFGAKNSILYAFGATAIQASFIAGAYSDAEGLIYADFEGKLKKVKSKPGVQVLGDYWSNSFMPKLAGGADFSNFVRATIQGASSPSRAFTPRGFTPRGFTPHATFKARTR